MLTGMLICVLWVVTWTPIFLTQLCVCVCVYVCVFAYVFDVIQLIKITKLKKTYTSDCCKQMKDKEEKRVEKLLDILERQDHELWPDFCDMLDKSNQPHVARLIRENVRQQQQQQQPSKHTHARMHVHTPVYHRLLTYCYFRS